MDTGKPGDTLSDQTLDREIAQALAVDPSPEFLARIRARVASEPAPAAGWFAWRFAGAAAVCVGVVALVAATWWEQGRVSVPEIQQAESPSSGPSGQIEYQSQQASERGLAAATAERPVVPQGGHTTSVPPRREAGSVAPSTVPPSVGSAVPLRTVQPRAAVAVKKTDPEVLISDEEAMALRQLFRDASSGRVGVAVMWSDPSQASEPLMPIREIAIEPINVSPLAPIGE